MALFENMFGSRAEFRPAGRLEKSDPLARKAYEAEKKTWEAERKAANEERKAYEKEMEKRYGKNWLNIVQSQKRAQQRSTRKAKVEKAAEDMRSGKTSSFVGKAGRDPYAGAGGKMITFKSQEEADKSGLTRYKLDEPQTFSQYQQMPGPVEVRKATPQQRVFKAMIEGKPEESQVFETEAEAKAFIKEKGGKGAVASVRGTPEEMARYKEESKAGEREKERLSKLYKQRQEEAQGRVAKAREAMQAYDEATTPAQKESARAGIEAARLESAMAQSTRGMSEEQRKKFAEGLGGVLERRKTREQEWEKRTEKARAESRAQQATASEERAINNQLKFYNQQLGTLRRAYNQARRNRDEGALFEIGQAIDAWSAGVPEDPKQQRDAARRGILREKFEQLERERRRREELARTNPDAAR